MASDNEIIKIENETIERYNRRLDQYGFEARSLGWDTKEHQFVRFATATRHLDFSKKHILDIGCGFSDFFGYLVQKNIPIRRYSGIDINERLITISKKRFPENHYEVRNILINNYSEPQADIITLFGLLNFKMKDTENLDYTGKMITESWKITRGALVIDFLSTNLCKTYPKEEAVYYHNPEDVLDMCFRLSDNLILLHNYPPIPQKEFMVILLKDDNS